MTTAKETEEKTEGEDGDDDDVMKPVGEPEESTAQPEATGLSIKRIVITDYYPNVCSVHLPNVLPFSVCPCMLCSKSTDTASEAVEKTGDGVFYHLFQYINSAYRNKPHLHQAINYISN